MIKVNENIREYRNATRGNISVMPCMHCFIHNNNAMEMQLLRDAGGDSDFIEIIKSIYHHLLHQDVTVSKVQMFNWDVKLLFSIKALAEIMIGKYKGKNKGLWRKSVQDM